MNKPNKAKCQVLRNVKTHLVSYLRASWRIPQHGNVRCVDTLAPEPVVSCAASAGTVSAV